MKTSDSIAKIIPAFLAAQREFKNVAKDKDNPFFKSKYADLAAVLEEIIPELNSHGICVFQSPAKKDGEVELTTTLFHESGEWVSGVASAKPAKDGPQEYGSVVTYLRRYALMALCGITGADDDDGNTASGPRGTKSIVPAKLAEPVKPAESVKPWSVTEAGQELDEAPDMETFRAITARIAKHPFDVDGKAFLKDVATAKLANLKGEK